MSPDKTKTISAANFLPKKIALPALQKAAKSCHGCHLYRHATQTVFGEGQTKAKLMILGEIPGEKEDQQGKPFVGPAGVFLRKAIVQIGIELNDIYFTNVVKHFKFALINNRKIHRSPVALEINACQPWLAAEIEVITPRVILCLGATAAKSMITKNFKLTISRGKWFKQSDTTSILATYHPSAILRAPDDEARKRMKTFFLKDIRKAADFAFV